MSTGFDAGAMTEDSAMTEAARVVHVAKIRTAGGREHGISRSSDGRLDVRLSAPDANGIGTSPEHLFAAAWSACFESAIGAAAERKQVALPAGIGVDAEVHLKVVNGAQVLSAQFHVKLPGVEPGIARSLIDEAHANCPYSKATRGNVDVAITLIE